MIWRRWTREYLPQWKQRLQWSKEHLRNLKKGELVWLVDYSVNRCEYKRGQIIEKSTSHDSVVGSASLKMAHGELNRPVVNLAPVNYDGVSEIENKTGKVGAISNRQQEPPDSRNELLKLKRLRICQNCKVVVLVTSKLLMGPTNVTASDPQVWL